MPQLPLSAKVSSILLLVLACYWPALHGDYLFDDAHFLRENRLVQSPDGLVDIWTSTEQTDYWPLSYTALWLQCRLWGDSTTGYHLVNLLLHAAASLLVWRVMASLHIRGGWLIGLLFAVHPVNVETAAWMFQQKTTLAAVCCFASWACYLEFDRGDVANRRRWYVPALGLFVFGLLAKTSVVMLPLLLLGSAWWRRDRVTRRDLLSSVPFLLAALMLGAVSVWFQTNRAMGGGGVRDDGFLERAATAGCAVWFYLSKAVWPSPLCFVYPRWQVDGSALLSHVPTLGLMLIAATAWRYRRSWGKAVLGALAYFVLALGPVLGFVDIAYMRYSLVADHWQYLAIVAPLALAVGTLWHFARLQSLVLQRTAAVAAAGVVAVCCVLSWREARVYRNETTLWTETIARNPTAWLAHNNLGYALMGQDRHAEAEPHLRTALAQAPDESDIVVNLCATLIHLKKVDEGLRLGNRYLAGHVGDANLWAVVGFGHALRKEFSQAARCLEASLKRKPDSSQTLELLGRTRSRLGDADGAQVSFRQALALNPRSAAAHVGLAKSLVAANRRPEARPHVLAALAADPLHVDAIIVQANLLADEGRLPETVAVLQAAVTERSDSAPLHAALGERLAATGRRDLALTHLHKAVEIDGELPETHGALADLLAAQGDVDRAIEHYEAALRLDGDLLEARKALGGLLAMQGRTQEAIAQYRTALASQPQWPAVTTHLAWLLATHAQSSDGEKAEALRLAEQVCRETQMRHPVALDTLAAAQAALGRLEEAAATAFKARDLALEMGQGDFARDVQTRIDGYRARRAASVPATPTTRR